MTDQKHEETATAEGMPEAPPPHVQSTTPLEVEVLHLRDRLKRLEGAFEGFLTNEQHNHPAVKTWQRMREAVADLRRKIGSRGSDASSDPPTSQESPTK